MVFCMICLSLRQSLVIAVALALALPVSATEARVDAEGGTPRPTATFAIPETPPWGFESSTGKPAGVLVQISERLSEISRIPVVYSLRPARRAIAEFRSGQADFLMFFEMPDREAPGIKVGTLLETQIVLITLDQNGGPHNLSELTGQAVGYIEGAHYGRTFEQATHFQKIAVRSAEHGLELVTLDRLSALVTFDTAVQNIMDSSEYSGYDFSVEVIDSGLEGQLYMSHKFPHTEYLPIFHGALEHMRRNGEIQDIIDAPRELIGHRWPSAEVTTAD
jgi:ABC-type amino acid transport substrate-binding protein